VIAKIDLGSDLCTAQRQNVKHVSHAQVLVLAIWAAEVLWTNLWLGLGHKELKEIPVYLTSTKRIIMREAPKGHVGVPRVDPDQPPPPPKGAFGTIKQRGTSAYVTTKTTWASAAGARFT